MPPDSHRGSPKLDLTEASSDEGSTAPKVKLSLKRPILPGVCSNSVDVKLSVTYSISPGMTATPSAKKRKTLQDHARDIVEAERAARLEITRFAAKEKTAREAIKRQAAQDTALEIERLRLEFQREEGARQRAHELAILERQIQLERIKSNIDPHLPF